MGQFSQEDNEHLSPRFHEKSVNPEFIPPIVKGLMQRLLGKSHSVYIVGGSVRDWFLGYSLQDFVRKGGDFDLTTSATVEEMEIIFSDYTKVLDGKDFGTIKLVIDQNYYEITTYRVESAYRDGRHPEEVIFTDQIEDDLSRRDFTINAMAADIEGNIIDPFHGKKDLEKKVIRTVGKASDRFTEDYLRLLRAVRFATTLDFEIEESTSKAMIEILQKHPDKFKAAVSNERLLPEIQKILSSHASNGIKLLDHFGLFDKIIQFQNESQKYTIEKLSFLLNISRGDWMVNFAITLATRFKTPNLKSCERYLKNLATSVIDREHIMILIEYFQPPAEYITSKWSDLGLIDWYHTLINHYKRENSHQNRMIADLCELYRIQNKLEVFDENVLHYSIEELEGFKQRLITIHTNERDALQNARINGNDLIRLGYSGKIIGLLLEEIHFSKITINQLPTFIETMRSDPEIMDKLEILKEYNLSIDEPLLLKIEKRRQEIRKLLETID